MTEATKPTDVTGLSFERAVEELESIVARLERGDVALEESIKIYERGEALKKHCEKLLSAAEAGAGPVPGGREHGAARWLSEGV